MNLQVEDIAKSFGFEIRPLEEDGAWISKVTNANGIVAVWEPNGLKVICREDRDYQVLKRWEQEGLSVEKDGRIPKISNLWEALDFFSLGDLDAIMIEKGYIEFPQVAKVMIADLNGYVKKKDQNEENPSMRDYSGMLAPFLKNLWGKLLSHQGLHAEAGTVFRESIELMPEFAEPYSNLGTLLWHYGKQREAFLLFVEAFLKNPHSHACQLNFFDAGYEMQEFQSMLNVIEKVNSNGADSDVIRRHMALCRYKLGQKEEAISLLKGMLENENDDQETKELLSSFVNDQQTA